MPSDYDRIAAAIQFIDYHRVKQPSLEQLAAAVELSPYHLQRLFRRWAGVSPKRFLQFLTVEYAKQLLQQSWSVLETSYESGLSGPGRLHDHFVTLEAVTPGEYKDRGAGLTIRYGIHASPFGQAFLAVTERGICALSFISREQDGDHALHELRQCWRNARICQDESVTETIARNIFNLACGKEQPLSLLIKGTNFQINVWKALLKIPPGQLLSYGQIAGVIDKPSAYRAVGQAVGANPIAYLIPCHRVIRDRGLLGGYRWGETRKRALIAWEAGILSRTAQKLSKSP